MKRVRTGTKLVMVLATLFMVAPSTFASQLNLLPILQISGQYSDNVFFSATNKQSDTFFLINPGIALDYASSKLVGSLAYQVGLQRYNDYKERDNDVHRLDASLGINLASGFYIDASDNLYVTTDPLAFDASGDRVQRDSFTYNHFTPGLSFQTGTQNWRLAGRYDRIDVDYKTLIDSYQNGFGGVLTGKLGARSSVNFDYFQFDRHFDTQNAEFNVLDYTGRRYGVRLDRRFSPRLSAVGYVGYEERKFKQDAAARNFDSVIYEAQLTGEFPNVFSWSITGNQRLNDLAVRGAYLIRRGTVDLRKSVADRLRLEFNGFIQNAKNDQLREEADMYGLRFEGQYLVAKFLNIWLGYEYLDRDSEQLTPFKENRVNFGLTLSYGL